MSRTQQSFRCLFCPTVDGDFDPQHLHPSEGDLRLSMRPARPRGSAQESTGRRSQGAVRSQGNEPSTAEDTLVLPQRRRGTEGQRVRRSTGDAPEHSSPVAPCQSQPACDPPIASQDILYFDLPGGEPSTRPVCQTRPQSASLTSCLCFSRSGTSLTYSGAYQGLCVGCHSF